VCVSTSVFECVCAYAGEGALNKKGQSFVDHHLFFYHFILNDGSSKASTIKITFDRYIYEVKAMYEHDGGFILYFLLFFISTPPQHQSMLAASIDCIENAK